MSPVFQNQRVAIIGAGPAGMSIAWYLRALGMHAVELFEAGPDVGGQSTTVEVEGVPVDIGSCHFTDGYFLTTAIARTLGIEVTPLPPATRLDHRGEIAARPTPDARLVARYLAHWTRWYVAGQMRQPTMPENALPFDEWLDRKGLGALASRFYFTGGLIGALYGRPSDLTAYSALTWMRPSMLSTMMFSRLSRMPIGFQNFWRRMAAHVGYRIHRRTRVDAVRPVRGSEPKVELHDGAGRIGEPFDHVFVTVPLDAIEHPLSDALRQLGPFVETCVYSGAWTAPAWPEQVPNRFYLPSTITGEPGRLITMRRDGVVQGRSVGQFGAFGLSGQSLEVHRERIRSDARDIVGLPDVTIVTDRIWRYHVRYSPAHLQAGLPGLISASQGKQNVWYSGGTLSHWDVESIIGFNHELVARFARQAGAPKRTRMKPGGWKEALHGL